MTGRVVVGAAVVAAAGALLAGDPARAWGAYLANVLFWSSLAAGAVSLSAAITVCEGRWAGQLQPLAEGWVRPLVAVLGLSVLLPLGADSIWPWAREPVSGLEGWLAPAAVFGRDAVALAGLAALALWFTRGTPGARTRRAVLLLLGFVLVWSLLAVDLVMSLEERWVSTLFGPYFFIGGAYAALASLAPLARHRGLELDRDTWHDLGKLLLGFALLWTYLFWSQYLVIWYGNLPREIRFWTIRTGTPGWRLWGTVVLLACFVVPFVALLSRELKRRAGAIALLSLFPLVGMWAERLFLVLPSLRPQAGLPLSWEELAVSGGIGSLVLATLPRRD